ncbi:hypothetical protein Cob_v003516 [Colletotrichum orbiculare MAFF 240422]|uniref:Uncharacterized protein n=1 Tax=Colletotrichum orbiculare (strain 104-T / ATCC 96160 / CBS 514.97 / LARS 414 / MAFF 240422) TaxID=1213857 RepID=A0A484FZZ0_COLOR|nr:hypothetical protein Cob_v003516 [Colletotrichum orbiculare MAFF 240422]
MLESRDPAYQHKSLRDHLFGVFGIRCRLEIFKQLEINQVNSGWHSSHSLCCLCRGSSEFSGPHPRSMVQLESSVQEDTVASTRPWRLEFVGQVATPMNSWVGIRLPTDAADVSVGGLDERACAAPKLYMVEFGLWDSPARRRLSKIDKCRC